MKNVKYDTKYIIKRILIGVGIAIILFNLKKCNVYALSSTYNIGAVTDDSAFRFSTSNLSSTNYLVNSYNVNDIEFNFYCSRNNIYTDVLFFIIEYNGKDYLYATYYKKNPDTDYNNISYYGINPSTSSLDYPPNLVAYNSDNSFFGNFASTTNVNMTQNYINSFTYRFYEIDLENVTRSSKTSSDKVLSYNILTNGNVIYTNYDKPLKVNDNILINPITDPLANYTKVDLTGYQAVLLVPKNYQTMLSDSSHTNESPPGTFRTYLDLEYYSQYCTRSSLINVENTQDIMLNNIGVGTGNIAETITGTCYEEPTQSIMSYEYDQYSGLKARGLLIYNAEQNWSGGLNPNEQESPFYGTSYVWYNPNLYNAYLVQSFESFSANIQYKDYSGEDKEVNVESLPTFNEAMENAIENVDSPTQLDTNKAKLTALFEFIKLPIVFIKRLSTNNCSPVILPLPHTGQNITLQCMSSSVYNRYLPPALTSVLSIIINGLLIYRCTLTNIDIFTNILDPVDNKLEAIDL